MNLDPVAPHKPHSTERCGIDRINPRLARRRERNLYPPVAAFADDAEAELRLAIAHPTLPARPCVFPAALLHHFD